MDKLETGDAVYCKVKLKNLIDEAKKNGVNVEIKENQVSFYSRGEKP